MAGVQGRIDHLSVDLNNQRLFVAALGNNTLEVLDIKGAKRLHTISGLHEPQGVLYVPGDNRLFVANATDGACRIYDASSFQLLKTVEYGDDADNIRFDAPARQVYVGYGSGALGILDLSGKKLGDIKLDAHPESFQLERKGTRMCDQMLFRCSTGPRRLCGDPRIFDDLTKAPQLFRNPSESLRHETKGLCARHKPWHRGFCHRSYRIRAPSRKFNTM